MPPFHTNLAHARARAARLSAWGLVGRRPFLWAAGLALLAFACWNVALGTIPFYTPLVVVAITVLVGGWSIRRQPLRRQAMHPWAVLDVLFPVAASVLATCLPALAFVPPDPPFPSSVVWHAAFLLPLVGDAALVHQATLDAASRMAGETTTPSVFLWLVGQIAMGGVAAVLWTAMGLGWPCPTPAWWHGHAARAAWALRAQGIPVAQIHLRVRFDTPDGFVACERPFHALFPDGFDHTAHVPALRQAMHPPTLPVRLPSPDHPDAGIRVLSTPVWALPSSAHARLADMARHGASTPTAGAGQAPA